MPIPVMRPDPLPEPPPPPPSTTTSRITGTWTAPSGVVIQLADCSTGVDWLAGREGTDMPPFEITEDPVHDGAGSTVRGVRAIPRDVVLPLLVHLDEYGDWRALQEHLTSAFDPQAGDGILTLRQPTGVARNLTGRYRQGMEGADIRDPRGLWYRIYPTVIRGHDPWWYDDTEEQVIRWQTDVVGGLLDDPFFPLRLTGASLLGDAVVRLRGTVKADPVWEVDGPASTVLFRHVRTGRLFEFDLTTAPRTLAGGQTMTIDTNPLRQTVTRSDGVNLYGARVGIPDLWSLDTGDNPIELIVTGGQATTAVRMRYRPRNLIA